MQLYFVKATYTNNVYKLGDFFLNGAYKLDPNKLLNINSMPNDDQTSFVTSKLTLPDTTDTRENTHVIVPAYNKIYRIVDTIYVNAQQYQFNLVEDPLIGNYLALEDTEILMRRTNDVSLFRGQNDVADLSLKETVETKVINSQWKTGKWALLFYQFDPAAGPTTSVGLNFQSSGVIQDYQAASIALLRVQFPEVTTDYPELFEYYQKIAFATGTGYLQCVYDGTGLKWVDYSFTIVNDKIYVGIQNYGAKLNQSDVITFAIALPFEQNLYDSLSSNQLVDYNHFLGPTGTNLIDVKIIDDNIFLKGANISYSLVGTTMSKTLTFSGTGVSSIAATAYTDTGLTVPDGRDVLVLFNLDNEFSINPNYGTITPTNAEPFNKYELYIYGQRFSIPSYLSSGINLLIAINSGVINFLIYYIDKRNVIASGSFTHSVRYSIDQLDAFYNENPTYKDQFYLKMGSNAFKTVAGGAMAGGMAGPIGIAGGAAAGLVTAGVDAGIGLANLHYMEKGLALKPDQIHGETSELALQLVNLFGIYWVKKTPENQDLMLQEYYLKGFPTSIIKKINALTYATSRFGTSKVVFGQIKDVIRNEYTTNFINEKLNEGIILVP